MTNLIMILESIQTSTRTLYGPCQSTGTSAWKIVKNLGKARKNINIKWTRWWEKLINQFVFIWFTGVGWAICITDIYMGMTYNTIIGWAVYYLYASFTDTLPWTSCGNSWNTNSCLPILHANFSLNSTTPAKEFFE